MFLMYGGMVFLYYYNDLIGAILTSASFVIVDFFVSLWATKLNSIWYGLGLLAGALVAWVICYFRLRWVERNIDKHIFCEGNIKPYGKGKRPKQLVYKRQ